jgi:threonine dehydrogenase-like Zn-dependent dehydrogenase
MSCKAPGCPGCLRSLPSTCLTNELDYAKAFDATQRSTPSRDVVEQYGRGVDTPFDAIGSEKSALKVIDAVAPGGRAVLVGARAWRTARRQTFQIVHGEKAIGGTYLRIGAAEYRFSMLAGLDLEKKSTAMF